MYHKINLDMESVLRDYQSQQLTPAKLAKKYGVSEITIRSRLAESGVMMRSERKGGKPKLTKEQEAEAIADYENGTENTTTLAKRYKVRPTTIRLHLIRAGVKMRLPNKHEYRTEIAKDPQQSILATKRRVAKKTTQRITEKVFEIMEKRKHAMLNRLTF